MYQLILENVVAGIVAGLAVAIILGIYRWICVYLERQYHIKYISRMISAGVKRVNDAGDDGSKLFYYNMLVRNLERVLDSDQTASRLTIHEIEQLLLALPYSTNGQVEVINREDKLPEDRDGFFRTVTSRFSEVTWLIR